MSANVGDVDPSQGTRRAFLKKAPDVRQLELIHATCRCLSRYGAVETSVRTIAQEAGLSLGMVRHHFHSKDELLAATLRYLSSRIQVEIRSTLASAGDSPWRRLEEFITSSLDPKFRDHEYVINRFLFWELARTNPVVRKVHDEIYRRYQRQLRTLVRAVAEANDSAADPKVLTIIVMALLKGIWVELSLAKSPLEIQPIIKQVLSMLQDALIGRTGVAQPARA